ncbi:MAG TPA: AmmeMemoRadiSam system protein B [Polyangiaceae bacterium]|nr:AmmeMemoRadiSam system protein B [Polyangiaceae bacterium]
MNVREAHVAGRFYPGDPAALCAEVERCLRSGPGHETAPHPAVAVVAPHAGYVYSGAIAGRTFASVRVPDRVIVLCPNHTGLGARRSVWSEGAWRIPGRDVPVDTELAELLIAKTALKADVLAHAREHAVEVQVPLLCARNPSLTLVPICLARLSFAECRELGEGLADVLGALPRAEQPLIVASTDMSHYISASDARELDALALERICALDAQGLHATVEREGLSMCGYVPTTVALVAARKLGAAGARLIEYGNSGAVSGDFDQVVGYAGLVVA